MKNFYRDGHVMPSGDGSGERSPTQQVAVPRTAATDLSTAPRTYSLVKFNSYRKRGKAGSPPAATSNPYALLKKVDWLAIFSSWAIINRSKMYTTSTKQNTCATRTPANNAALQNFEKRHDLLRFIGADAQSVVSTCLPAGRKVFSGEFYGEPSICATRTPANNAALKGLAIAKPAPICRRGGTTVVPKIFMVRRVVAELRRSTHHDIKPDICATRTPANNAALQNFEKTHVDAEPVVSTCLPAGRKFFSGEFYGDPSVCATRTPANNVALQNFEKRQTDAQSVVSKFFSDEFLRTFFGKKYEPCHGSSGGKVAGRVNTTLSSNTIHTPLPSTLHLLLLLPIFISVFICFSGAAKAQSRQDVGTAEAVITGKIVSASSGQPIQQATIVVAATQKQAFSDKQGLFKLITSKDSGHLVISCIGYKTDTVQFHMGAISLSIELQPQENILDEAIVIGYGTTTRRFNTGSIGQVADLKIRNQPVSNPLSALSGRIPGVIITQSSGVPGAQVNMEIQGRNNLNPNTSAEPLFIIDGVPFASNNEPTNLLGNTALSPLALINPADIASIEVLKDADATAIYGSRGAYGVVLITTKIGDAGTTKVNFSTNTGISKVTRMVNLLDTEQYLEMRREAFANDGVEPTATRAPDLLYWEQDAYTDWQNELIGGLARSIDSRLSVSGGGKNTRFVLSGGYNKEGLVFRHTKPYTRVSTHIGLEHSSVDNRFKFSFSGGYSANKTRNTISDLTNLALILPPNYPKTRDELGNLLWEHEGNPLYYGNPFAYIKENYESGSDGLLGNLHLSYLLSPSFSAKVNFGYSSNDNQSIYMSPRSSKDPRYNVDGHMETGDNRFESWIVEPQLGYDRKTRLGKWNGLVGLSFQQTDNARQRVTATGFTNDELMGSLGAATNYNLTSTYSQYRYTALFGRLNYVLRDRYIFNISGRRDGSSRFNTGEKFGNFGALGAAWILTEESWIKDRVPFINYAKVRASYGVTGSDKIGDYQYLETWTNVTNPYHTKKGLYPRRLANSDFKWEANRKLSLGLELGTFNDRVYWNITYFDNRSNNHLVTSPLPLITGFPSIIENFPATVQNKGWELTLNASPITKHQFKWEMDFNLTLPKNILRSFPDIERSNYANTYIVGKSLNLIRAFESQGVDPETGVYVLIDRDGDGSLNAEDRIYFGHLDPKVYGGLNNGFQYKGLRVDLFLEFKKQQGKNYMASVYTGSTSVPGYLKNVPIYLLDRWQKEGDETHIQRFTANSGTEASRAGTNFANGFNTAIFTDASYLRLKNISMQYTLPSIWTERWKMQDVQLYFRGQNFLTWTRYKGADPEVQDLRVLPPLRTLLFGVEFTI